MIVGKYFMMNRCIPFRHGVYFLLVTACLLGSGVGCQKGKPKNFPKLVPATIVVLKSGVPAENVNIVLCQESPVTWVCGGSTDKDGCVQLSTVQGSYSQPGAPVGNYSITVSYTPFLNSDKDTSLMSTEERIAHANVQKAKIKKAKAEFGIPEILGDVSRTPVKWTINSHGENKLTIEVTDYKK